MDYLEYTFAVLGIEPTRDKRTIKKAYAQKVRQYHPEEYPEEWKKIHEAYQAAMAYASGCREKHEEPLHPQADAGSGGMPEYREEPKESNEQNEPGDQYENTFDEIKSENEVQRQKAQGEVLARLGALMRNPRILSLPEWESFFQGESYKSCCDNEIVLHFLVQVFWQIRLTRETADYVLSVLEDQRLRLSAGMRAYEAGLLEQAQDEIRVRVGYGTTSPDTHAAAKQKKKRPAVLVLLILLISAGVIFALAGRLGKRDGNVFSEQEAKEEIAAYLNEKYPQIEISPEKIDLFDQKIYSSLDKKYIHTGYRGYIRGGKEMSVLLIGWENGKSGERISLCFDNYQEQQITGDLQAEILGELGYETGMVYLSANGDSLISDLFGSSSTCYHTLYEGDTATFFEREARVREQIMQAFAQLAPLGESGIVSPNGRCAVYLRDPVVESIRQRLENPDSTHLDVLERVLGARAEEYRIHMEGVVFTGEFYDKISLAAAQDETFVGSTLRSGGYTYESCRAPFAGPVMTGWYQSEDHAYEGRLYIQQAEKAAEGIYLMDQEGPGAVKRQSADNEGDSGDILDEMRIRLDEIPNQVEETEMPELTDRFLREDGTVYQSSKSFLLKGGDRRVLMVLDKEKLGLPENGYTAVLMEGKTDYSEAECKRIEISDKLKDGADSFYNRGYDVSGYVMAGINLPLNRRDIITFVG